MDTETFKGLPDLPEGYFYEVKERKGRQNFPYILNIRKYTHKPFSKIVSRYKFSQPHDVPYAATRAYRTLNTILAQEAQAQLFKKIQKDLENHK